MFLLKTKVLFFLTINMASLGCLSYQLGLVKTLINNLCHASQLCVCVHASRYTNKLGLVQKVEYKDCATHYLVAAWGHKMVVTCLVSFLI